jgi:hypothetical protein
LSNSLNFYLPKNNRCYENYVYLSNISIRSFVLLAYPLLFLNSSIQSGDNSPYISSIPLTGTIPLSYHWWFHPNHRYVDIPKGTWFQMVWLLISLYIQLLSTMNNFPYRQWVQTGAYNYNLNLFLNKFLNDNEYIIYVHCPRIWNLFVPALESGGKVSLCVQTPMSNKS